MRVLWPALGLVVGLPLVVFVLAGFPLSFSVPQMGRFNVSGGVEILPEFAALVVALSVYTAAFIAEVVRAGVLAVPARSDRSRTGARACVPPRRCGLSSCRRRCASSFRR